MEILEDLSELGKKITENIDLKNIQETFINSNITQIVNTAIDMGLKSLLPDFLENEVIDVKNKLIEGGLEDGINSAIVNTIKVGKKLLGLENSNFNSIEQAKDTINKGNLANNVANNIDSILEKVSNSISGNIVNIIKDGKELVLDNINTNVEIEFNNELKALGKIEKYIKNWEKYYLKKDVEGLNNELNKIEKQMKKILPIEEILNKVENIRSINGLIEEDNNFDFSEIYLDLAKAFKKID